MNENESDQKVPESERKRTQLQKVSGTEKKENEKRELR